MTPWSAPLVVRPVRFEGTHPDLMHAAVWLDTPAGPRLVACAEVPTDSAAEAMAVGRVLLEWYRAQVTALGGIVFEPVDVVLDGILPK